MAPPIAPKHIMEIKDFEGTKTFYNNYTTVDELLLHPDVKDRKISIVSIIGEYRKGKSFFLDYCLRFMYAKYRSLSKMTQPDKVTGDNWMGKANDPLQGFSWKHGYKADTKGILFWPDVFLYDQPNGEKIAVIIMDTQGLFELNSTQEENARIFGLSTLISSIQIVNLRGEMQENQIEYLEMATSLTKFITQKQLGKTNWKPFQRLLFLVRDWVDETIEGGFGYAGGKTYFNDFLSIKKGSGTQAEAIRKNIHGSFDKIECFLMNHPGMNVTKADFKGEWGKLESRFTSNLKTLIESILEPQNLNIKSILGKRVTGAEFRNFICSYLDVFRDTKLPEVENILQMTIDKQMKAIMADKLLFYQTMVSDSVDFNQKNFEQYIKDKHLKTKNETIQQYMRADKFDDEESIRKYKTLLDDEIEKIYGAWRIQIFKEQQRFIKFKAQIDELNLQKDEQKKAISDLNNKVLTQFKESEDSKRKYDLQIKQQQEQAELLKTQIKELNLNAMEKEKEMQKAFKEVEEKSKSHDERFLKAQETQMKENKEMMEKFAQSLKDSIEESNKVVRLELCTLQ